MKSVFLVKVHSYDKPIAFESLADAMHFANMAASGSDEDPSTPDEVLYVPFDSYTLRSTAYTNLATGGICKPSAKGEAK